MKVLLIDAVARQVREADYETAEDLRKLVGGWIAVAATWPSGDVLYVDDEGLFKPQTGFFVIPESPQPLAGNGVICGRETSSPKGEYTGTAPPSLTIEAATAKVRFLSHGQASAWGRANANEPAVRFTSFEKDGSTTSKTMKTFGSLFSNMPKPPAPAKIGDRIRVLSVKQPLSLCRLGVVASVVALQHHRASDWLIGVALDDGTYAALYCPPDQFEGLKP